jgi:putative FmdB family regulatory protein
VPEVFMVTELGATIKTSLLAGNVLIIEFADEGLTITKAKKPTKAATTIDFRTLGPIPDFDSIRLNTLINLELCLVPTYEYICNECELTFEAVQSFSDEPISICPACGKGVRKVYSNVGVVFKGAGFYKTDSRKAASASTTTTSTTSSTPAPAPAPAPVAKSTSTD